MSFWDLSNNESATAGVSKEYEQDTGNFDPIPNNSSVLAIIDEAKWQTARDSDAEYISLRWSITGPEEYANRKVFQKLWVQDDDPQVRDADKMDKKRDKAKRMLAAIDANCGGKLAKKTSRPTDDDLALALTNRPMVIKVMIWEMKGADGSLNFGNWIAAVGPKEKPLSIGESKPKPAPRGGGTSMSAQRGGFADDLDDDIPFMTADSMF